MFCCSFLCLGNASWCTVFVQVSCEATPWGWIFVIVVLKENHHSGCVLVNVHVVWPDVDVRIYIYIYKWVYINGYYWHLLTIGSLLESGLLTICLEQWFLILVTGTSLCGRMVYHCPTHQAWCCDHEHRGCPSSKSYNCTAGVKTWKSAWSEHKKLDRFLLSSSPWLNPG